MEAWTGGIPLRHASEAPLRARLREPQGSDELAVAGVDTRSAVQLLDRLLEPPPCPAAQLSASDRDALLAALHRRLWGDRILCSLQCPACESMYDLSFDLSTLQRQMAEQGEASRTLGLRRIADAHGAHFDLPSAAEEEAAAERGLNAGIAQLAEGIAGEAGMDPATLGARLETLAPLLDIELDAPCAECGHRQRVRFDIQSFVLQRLLDEREGLLSEVHALASGYGWSLGEIVGLPRSLRRSLVQRLGASTAAFR